MPYARVAGAYVGQPYKFVSVPFSGCEYLEIIFANQVAYNDKFYVSMPESNSRKSNALARVLLFSPKRVTNLNQIYIYE